MPMMAMTTKSSTRVNPFFEFARYFVLETMFESFF